MKEENNSNKSTEGTGLFFAWKMAKLAFDFEILIGLAVFFYCWRWLNINFFLSLLIGIGIGLIIMIFLTIFVFPVMRKIAKKKGKD
jgi:hypothetical protein